MGIVDNGIERNMAKKMNCSYNVEIQEDVSRVFRDFTLLFLLKKQHNFVWL